jgi:hypothetical protein
MRRAVIIDRRGPGLLISLVYFPSSLSLFVNFCLRLFFNLTSIQHTWGASTVAAEPEIGHFHVFVSFHIILAHLGIGSVSLSKGLVRRYLM